MQVNPTRCATAPWRQIVLNLLGSELVPSFVITCNLCCPPNLANILLRQWFFNADMSLLPYMCFTQEVASDSTQITIATWIQRLPKEWSSRMLSRQSQLLRLPLTQQTQTIHCCYQRKSTAHMEHYVAFHQLTSEWLHRYNQFGYWLTSFSYP